MGRRQRVPDAETLQRARDLMQHPLFPSLMREAAERVRALQLEPQASTPAKRKAPQSRSDKQVLKRRLQNNQHIFDRRETEKSKVESLRSRSAEEVSTLALKRYPIS
jgi:hypothetical protein